MQQPNLILIGLRASGKSTLGRLLAQELGRDFVDLDRVVAEQMDASGPGEIIEREGIDAFRFAETQALRSVLEHSGQIIALGGGTPTAPGAADLLREADARIIYLRATPETLRERLSESDNTDRPALVGTDALDEVQTLFEQRDPLYRQLAQSVVHVDGVREEAVLRALLALAKAD
ncbi:MAG: shikimate kinase [Phycisphaerae bacterium]|nr:shikimate kinase [Phycisphaerae bacterium]MBM92012.1 shikimate kinase [Phycisphaerae bacterium]HCT45845.1 shikimate kinase [Phycisphaerales bacterium]|tara:strand:+ start:142 stop:669 length:528 start_codon:yes stop_codon:yes gene_type:complete